MGKEKTEKKSASTGHRRGRIVNVGVNKQKITWNQGAGRKNIRLIVKGTRETAEKILQKLREEYYSKIHGISIEHDTTVTDLAQLVVDDYQTNDYKDLRNAKYLQKFWRTFAGTQRADTIDTDQLAIWVKEWRKNGLSPARANRRISFLLRGYRLAFDRSGVKVIPKWEALKEAPPRSGTRSWEEFLAVRDALPAHAKVPVTIEYWLGTRAGETHALEWPQVRFRHKDETVEIRLRALDTKSGEQRVAILGGDLYDVLRDWDVFTRSEYPGTKHVCHYKGAPLKNIKTSWQTACVRVGLGEFLEPDGAEVGNRKYRGALVHDFRRTAVTRMEDAGIPRKTAMAISGHKTDSVFRRYHIVRKADLEKAGQLLLAHHEQEHGSAPTRKSSTKKVFNGCSVPQQNTPNHPGSGRTRHTPSKQRNAASRALK